MRLLAGAVVCLGVLLAGNAALAWGAKGHAYVGAIADSLLTGKTAGDEAQQILGYDLKTAATWADCVRSVKKGADGSFVFTPDPRHPEYTAACTAFETPDETARMEDYARRNWDNCPHLADHGCHESYHFADVDRLRNRYDRDDAGTSDHDIVSAIDAAVLVLQGQPAPAPFSIKDKKEALLLIAHFVGDLHQPLHVGAVYLAASGKEVDADKAGIDVEATATHGGNAISDGKANLHTEWDAIPSRLGNVPSRSALAAAKNVAPTNAPVGDLAADWASDTVMASHKAFAGLRFAGAGAHHWKIVAKPKTYAAARARLQTCQLEKAGARLAALLEAIWP